MVTQGSSRLHFSEKGGAVAAVLKMLCYEILVLSWEAGFHVLAQQQLYS
jgi:hypothetical protein